MKPSLRRIAPLLPAVLLVAGISAAAVSVVDQETGDARPVGRFASAMTRPLPVASLPNPDRSRSEAAADLSDSSAAAQQLRSVEQAKRSPNPPASSEDDRLRELLVGRWTQQLHGNRLLTVHADGTATVDVRPEGLWKWMFGDKLRLDVEWQLAEGRLICETTGGEPPAAVDLVAERWGRSRHSAILALTPERLSLEDDDETSDWTRVVEPAE